MGILSWVFNPRAALQNFIKETMRSKMEGVERELYRLKKSKMPLQRPVYEIDRLYDPMDDALITAEVIQDLSVKLQSTKELPKNLSIMRKRFKQQIEHLIELCKTEPSILEHRKLEEFIQSCRDYKSGSLSLDNLSWVDLPMENGQFAVFISNSPVPWYK